MQSKEGLRFILQMTNYQGEGLMKLVELEAVERKAVWEQELERAKPKAKNRVAIHEPDKLDDTEYIKDMEWMIAEKAMLDQHMAPPHWTGVIKCMKCGEMPAYKEQQGLEVLACPWCFVGRPEEVIPF